MITTTDVQLYRWYKMGITDVNDLKWLLWFYHHGEWPLSIVSASLQSAREYFKINKVKAETRIVIDVLSLELDEDTYDYLADFYEVGNDSYHRYYLSDDWNYINQDVKEILNCKLEDKGILADDVKYVLLRFSW